MNQPDVNLDKWAFVVTSGGRSIVGEIDVQSEEKLWLNTAFVVHTVSNVAGNDSSPKKLQQLLVLAPAVPGTDGTCPDYYVVVAEMVPLAKLGDSAKALFTLLLANARKQFGAQTGG